MEVDLPAAGLGWHYDLDEYVQVRLGETEDVESRILSNLLQQKGPVQPDAHEALMVFVIHHAVFWATLAEKITNSGYAMIDPYLMAREMFQLERDFDKSLFYRVFGLSKRRVARVSNEGGLLLSSAIHERMMQIANVDLAVQMLLVADLDDIYATLGATATPRLWLVEQRKQWEEDRDTSARLIRQLQAMICPLAFTVLWMWKCHVRWQSKWNEDDEERLGLWRLGIKLYGLCATFAERDLLTAPTDLEGVFAGNVSGTKGMVLDVPILEQSLKELWATWSALMWRSPGLQIGSDFRECVRLMMLRVGYFVSYAGTVDLFDFPKYVHIPEQNLERYVDNVHDMALTVNDVFLRDTERIFFYLLEACFTTQHLTPSSPALRATAAHHAAWEKIVCERLGEETASFVQMQVEKHGWYRYTYLDEIERFQRRMHARIAMPRKVLGDFRQSDCDAVFEVLRGKNPLELLWQSAHQVVAEDQQRRQDTVGSALDRGWSWRMAWDIRTEMEKKIGLEKADLPPDIEEIFDEATGESTYIFRRTKKRVRGERLVRLQMAKSVRLSAAGLVAKNLLEEIALKVLLRMDKRGGSDDIPLYVFSTHKATNHLTLMHLLSHGTQPAHKLQNKLLGEFPVLLSHLNHYYIFDGKTNYARVENIVDALYAWTLTCEGIVRKKLSGIVGRFDSDASAEANEQLLREAEQVAGRIPNILRQMFDLLRDPLVMQPHPTHYHIPHNVQMPQCAWDAANISRFFVQNYPSLNISRTLLARKNHLSRGLSMSSDASSSASLESQDEDLSLGGRELLGSDDEDDSDYHEEPPDILQLLGGIAW